MKAKNLTLLFLILFLVAFPKGGLKVAGVPLTFGYIFLGITAAICLPLNIVNSRFSHLQWNSVLAYVCTLPLLAVSVIQIIERGASDASYTLAYLISFSLLPILFFIILSPQINSLDRPTFLKYLRPAVSFVAAFGIVLFCYLLLTGSFIEVPYLTVNADDIGQLSEKNIKRGEGIFKLISTYNNGNIYGVSILMILGLYDLSQKSILWRLLVRASLILTLSRTVWIGLFIYELISAFYLRPLKKSTLIYLLVSVSVALSAVIYAISLLGFDSGFIFDSNLGGRADNVRATNWTVIGEGPVRFPSEIIAVNIVSAFGISGLLAFMLATMAPIWLAFSSKFRLEPVVKGCITGMSMLLICGLSDGPILLIPIMAFYWAFAAIALNTRAESQMSGAIDRASAV